MATWTAFYVKTTNEAGLKEKLIALTGISTALEGRFPSDFHNSYLIDEAAPSYLVFTSTQPGWVTIVYNSAHKLADWCIDISKQFNTQVIVTLAQNTSDYYYFALYDKGEMKRELEYCYSEDYIPTNFGKKFDFESEEPGDEIEYNGDRTYLFDFDSIERYCSEFGLTIQCNYQDFEWSMLKGRSTGKTVAQAVKELHDARKPWWKFW